MADTPKAYKQNKEKRAAEKNDTRPIEEQLRDMFGDGSIPEFSNPEFRKKK